MLEIEAQGPRKQNPAADCDYRSRQSSCEPLFDIGSQKIDQFHREYGENNGDGPPQVGQIAAKTLPNPTFPASQPPKFGPTSIRARATISRNPIRNVSPIARGRVFQNGRFSCTSYATFKASIMLENPPDAAQIVPMIPNESKRPR